MTKNTLGSEPHSAVRLFAGHRDYDVVEITVDLGGLDAQDVDVKETDDSVWVVLYEDSETPIYSEFEVPGRISGSQTFGEFRNSILAIYVSVESGSWNDRTDEISDLSISTSD